MNKQPPLISKKKLLLPSGQLKIIQKLLVNDFYFFLDSELKITNYSTNLITFSTQVLKHEIGLDTTIKQLLSNIDKDLSEIKLQEFFAGNICHETICFKFQIGGEQLMLTVFKLTENNATGYCCLMESHKKSDDFKGILENMHTVANLSWFTSHKLRGPLSTILNLINNSPLPEIVNNEQLKLLFSQMKKQAMNLDDALHTLNHLLADKDRGTQIVPQFSGENIQNILMLDDEIIIHKLSQKIVTDINPELNLFSFTEGIEALEFLHTFPVDLILLDLNMPHINGWEFLQMMTEKGIEIPTIIISSSIDTNDVNRSFEYKQVKGFFNKPITKADLKNILTNSSN